ncbi:hypothetical protein Zmor_021129 [Zophobas morio]|uniref:Very long-chain fatty acid transport protein n=1 Tax=Zophobas morio TaxID=2755281 RepID=A0AA38I5E5_9CUCU|nr:hypothetical protein Zmor_021129 [Zophobas morio]
MFLILISLVAVLFLYKAKLKNGLKILLRDSKFLSRIILLKRRFRTFEKKGTVAQIFTSLATKHPSKVIFYFEDEQWTFLDVEVYSNKIANFFKQEGYQREDTVALFHENSPKYPCVWLGLSKLGVISAFINTNLTGDVLIHALKSAKVTGIIYGSTLNKAISNITGKIPGIKLYQLLDGNEKTGVLDGSRDLTLELKMQSESSPTEELANGKITDKLMLIYTSGTTGLPKPTIITNKRAMSFTFAIKTFTKLSSEDIFYVCLPIYHSAGSVPIVCCFLYGSALAMRKKFSASNFWKDCYKYKCTIFQYIGEICRYLLASRAGTEFHIHHHLKTITGNGLRPQIWKEFVTKFNIKYVYEFYTATDGNVFLINTHNKVGAVGFFPRWASFMSPIKLIKFDEDTSLPLRGSDGFYQVCKTGEPGVLIGKMDVKDNSSGFVGYLDERDTEKKILRNVFKVGDAYVNSGDILVQDDSGYFYFKDRTGDTFRWKGENVSTTEIESVITNLLNLNDVIVYGVEVPGVEGRAGMVALIDSSRSLNMEKFYKDLKVNLPSYAIPLFVRVVQHIPVTGTFKLQKVHLRRQGFDIEKNEDPLYVFDVVEKKYVILTKEKYDEIISGKIKF